MDIEDVTLRTIILIDCISGETRRCIGFTGLLPFSFTSVTKAHILRI